MVALGLIVAAELLSYWARRCVYEAFRMPKTVGSEIVVDMMSLGVVVVAELGRVEMAGTD